VTEVNNRQTVYSALQLHCDHWTNSLFCYAAGLWTLDCIVLCVS